MGVGLGERGQNEQDVLLYYKNPKRKRKIAAKPGGRAVRTR